ncbi:flavin reductase [SCandidatus Aminicenantes bacterium Aminicenantia_JdfR_composite]|jgi:flavin reductase (DIM6/NTAB) family NADH-FMN oxidoreductase RutF/rubredoxin|nr:flavin reductase [SCandidatus Aminicenantes bacterium Aminicenantia_JdfR_composite]MCP2596243.1 flavin reductase [Candidatus Aminicenantes bacterium AC-335-G13]MCP2597818.1 flavin reductase [Candidatus Aminicenantes bacterium AC-335-L06]MCP2606152.1 flavin reductase [Candidatus Aminicenantes bacterium AC-708-I09]
MDLKILYKISYGLYVVTSKKNDKINGQIANTVFQVASEPPTIAVSINKNNLTHEFIQNSGIFAVSVLSKDTPMKLIGNFGFKSGREIDKFKEVKYKTGATGAPIILESTLGYLETETINNLDVGTHTIFIGKILNAEIIGEGEPMTYAYYHQVKKGRAPKSAPTYMKEINHENLNMGGNRMAKYECTICGYIYDPEKGDPDSGIDPGTSFEELPDDWVCPVCGAWKSAFKQID